MKEAPLKRLENLVEITYSLDLTLHLDECTFNDMMTICNALDGYEVERGVEELLVVDVLESSSQRIILRITPKDPITYHELSEYIQDMIRFAMNAVNNRTKIRPANVKWNVGVYGTTSRKLDVRSMMVFSKRFQVLDKLRLQIAHERESDTEMKYHIESGYCYLIKEKYPDISIEVFIDYVTHNIPGLWFTRNNPKDMKSKYELKATPIVWLTQNEVPGQLCIAPIKIEQINNTIIEFIENTEKSVILIDCIEYLITQNTFMRILKFMQTINDEMMLRKGIAIIPIDVSAIAPQEESLLERELKVLNITKY